MSSGLFVIIHLSYEQILQLHSKPIFCVCQYELPIILLFWFVKLKYSFCNLQNFPILQSGHHNIMIGNPVVEQVYSNEDDLFKRKNKKGAAFLMSFFDDSCDAEGLSNILPAIINSVDPSLRTDDTENLANTIIEKSEDSGVTENDILYGIVDLNNVVESKWLFVISLED